MSIFQFCNDCYYEYLNAPSRWTPTAQTVSAIAASAAVYVAWKNLGGLKRTQSLQAQMSLISLENEVRKNYIQLKVSIQKYTDESTKNPSPPTLTMTSLEKINAFELYVATADKLAALLSSEFLKGQFIGRDWESEYSEIFKKVLEYHSGEDSIIPGKSQMINNITILLKEWEDKKKKQKK